MPEFTAADPVSAFFLVCFFLGVVFVLLSAVIGATQDLGHLPGLHHGGVDVGSADSSGGIGDVGAHGGDLGQDIGHDVGHADASGSDSDGARQGTSASPLNVMTIMAFLTWFGGAGYIAYSVLGLFLPIALLAAVAAGLLAGWLVFMFLVKVLLPGTAAGEVRAQSLVGTVARVSIAIGTGRVGEIVYTLGGARHSDGARSVDGGPLERDKEVVIVRFEQGIAYVEEWERFVDSAEEAPDSRDGLPAGHPAGRSGGDAGDHRG